MIQSPPALGHQQAWPDDSPEGRAAAEGSEPYVPADVAAAMSPDGCLEVRHGAIIEGGRQKLKRRLAFAPAPEVGYRTWLFPRPRAATSA